MGATALDLKYFKDNNVWSIPPFNTSMNVQLQWFDEVKQTICSDPQGTIDTTRSESLLPDGDGSIRNLTPPTYDVITECRSFFSKSLFVFGEFGGNDYSFAWKAEWSLEKVKTMVPAVVASLVRGVERLLDEGARHVVVPGNLPAGCIPITLTMYPSEDRSEYDPRTGCLKRYNSVALYHNAMLRIALDRLQRRRPEARVVYADYYTPYIQFARTPHLYGQSSIAFWFICSCAQSLFRQQLSISREREGTGEYLSALLSALARAESSGGRLLYGEGGGGFRAVSSQGWCRAAAPSLACLFGSVGNHTTGQEPAPSI